METPEIISDAVLAGLYLSLFIASIVRWHRRRLLDRQAEEMFGSSRIAMGNTAYHHQTPRSIGKMTQPSMTNMSMTRSILASQSSVHSYDTPMHVSATSPQAASRQKEKRFFSRLRGAIRPESRPVYAVYGSLFVYSLARTISLIMGAAGALPRTGSLGWDLAMTIPSFTLMLMQVALTYRWVKVVELLQSIQRTSQSSRVGMFAVISGLLVAMLYAVLSIIILIAYHSSAYQNISELTWGSIINIYVGISYAYNGLAFIILGFLLFYVGSEISESLVGAQRKILTIALVFGLMGFLRGVTLIIVYITNEHDMKNLRRSWWGAPAVLLAEWLCIAAVVFVLGSTAGAVGQAASQPSSPVVAHIGREEEGLTTEYDAYA